MNAFELLQKWPFWEKANAETIFASPAWAMPVHWGNISCIMRKAEVNFRDVLGISIRLDDEDNFIGISNNASFKDLYALWEVKSTLPDALKLALVERECWPLFQIIENAARHQLNVLGVAKTEARKGSTGFEIVSSEGKTMATFDLKVTPEIVRAFGMLKCIDVNHSVIRSMTCSGRAVYASFRLTDEEKAGLAPGDFLMMPEIGTIAPKWQFDLPKETIQQICAPEETDISFAQFVDDALPEVPLPTELVLMENGAAIARGRLARLAESPAFAIEEVI